MKYILMAFFTLMVMAYPVMAAEKITATYGVYAGGFNVAKMNAIYDVSGARYDVKVDLTTAGVLGSLAPWSGDIQTKGDVKNGQFIPQTHKFANTWRGSEKISEFTFNKDGSLKSLNRIYQDGTIKDRMPGKAVIADKPVDMLTALMQVSIGDSCASKQPTLDGKRRFDMVFNSKGAETLGQSKYNIYTGVTEICEVEIVPVAGQWRDKPRGWMNIQSQAKTEGQLPRLWFASVKKDAPKIPVRMVIKTNYGAMIMHLQDVK